MKKLIKHTKGILKKIQKIQKTLKDSTPVEKFELPDTQSTETKENIQIVAISSRSVAKATLTIIGILILAYVLFQLQSLLIIFFVALFFSAALDPAIDWLENKRIPRPLGVLIIFMLLFTLIITIVGSMVPIIIEQITQLLTNFADWSFNLINKFQSEEGLDFLSEPYKTWASNAFTSFNLETLIREVLINLSSFTNQIKEIASGSLKTIGSTVAAGASVTISIASGLFNFLLVILLTFFMVVDKGSLNGFFHSLFPKKYGSYISEKTHAIQKQIGAWMRGQMLLSLIMFITTFIGLLIIGMGEYALTLAMIMAIGEFIPYIGPMIFLMFALPVAFGISFTVILKLLVFYGILQFIEGNIFVPAVMKKAVGLSPIVVLLVLIIGWQFLGILGAIIAVPVTTAAAIFLSDYMKSIAKK